MHLASFISVLQNKAMMVGIMEVESLYLGNKIYMGKEKLFSNGYAFIIPKASPLKARVELDCRQIKPTFQYFSERLLHGHRLVERHGTLRQDVQRFAH